MLTSKWTKYCAIYIVFVFEFIALVSTVYEFSRSSAQTLTYLYKMTFTFSVFLVNERSIGVWVTNFFPVSFFLLDVVGD